MTDRFCLSERTSPSSTSSVSAATYMARGRLLAAAVPRTAACGPPKGPAGCRYLVVRKRLGPRLLPHLERLDDVLDPDVVVADADAALVALADLGRIVLEPAQRLHREVVGDHHAVPDHPRLAVSGDRAGADDAARDGADPRHLEELADLGGAKLDLLELGLEHALERGLDLFDRLVDDRVVADVHALALRQLACPASRPDVEADDHRGRGDGQVHVVLRDRTDTAANDPGLDLL